MKTQIDKLIELAKAYVVFGIEIGLPDTHNRIRGNGRISPEIYNDGDIINVYFASKGDTWQITFKDVKVSGYLSSIEIPFNADEKYLNDVYESAREYLYGYLLPDVAKCKIETMKQKHIKIKELERELKKLKGL